jgi:hypothetical protein
MIKRGLVLDGSPRSFKNLFVSSTNDSTVQGTEIEGDEEL